MKGLEDFSIHTVFREFDDGLLELGQIEPLICGLAWSSLKEPSLAVLEQTYPCLLKCYSTRLLEGEVANGELVQAVYNLEKGWFLQAAEGYEEFGELELSNGILDVSLHVQNILERKASESFPSLIAFKEALEQPGALRWFNDVEDNLIKLNENGCSARSDYLLSQRDELVIVLDECIGKRLPHDEKQRIMQRAKKYMNRKSR